MGVSFNPNGNVASPLNHQSSGYERQAHIESFYNPVDNRNSIISNSQNSNQKEEGSNGQ